MWKESSRFSASRITSRSESLPIKMPTCTRGAVTLFPPSISPQDRFFQRSSRDIPAIVHPLPRNFADSAIGLTHCGRNVRSARGHSQHSSPRCHPMAILFSGAGVKNKTVVPIPELLQAGYFLTLLIRARITVGAQYDTGGRIIVPFGLGR